MPAKKKEYASSKKPEKTETLSHEEHEARAMLLGLHYHHGNGDPFYYRPDENGLPEWTSLVDASTMEPMVGHKTNQMFNIATDETVINTLRRKGVKI